MILDPIELILCGIIRVASHSTNGSVNGSILREAAYAAAELYTIGNVKVNASKEWLSWDQF